MESLFFLVQFVLGFSVVLFLIWPLLVSFGTSYEQTDQDVRSSDKRMIVDALADIEYEHETGKISDDDYKRLREDYLREAAEVFDDEDFEDTEVGEAEPSGDLEERIERERERLT